MGKDSRRPGIGRIWLDLSLSRKGVAIVAIPVLCIFAMLGLLAYLRRLAEAADQAVIQITQALAESNEIIADSLSLEATTRGYLLTREPEFLARHRLSRGQLFNTFSRILRLTEDNPEQQERMRRAMRLMQDEATALETQLALAPSSALTEEVDASRRRIDALRAEIEDFDREERRLLELRQASRLVHRGNIRLSFIGFALAAVFAGILGVWLFTSAVERRLERIASNAARYSRRKSKGPVDGSSDAIGQLEAALIGASRELLDREEQLSKTAAELERAKTAAESAARANTEFVATVSHEIRSPMNALLGAADLLQSTGLDGRQSEYVALLNRAGTNLLATVNEVLDHAKIEAGQFELEKLSFDCAATVEKVAQLFSVSAAEKGLNLVSKYTPETPRHVVGDPNRLQRVLINLVSNAIKFTDSGVVAIEVEPADMPGMLHFSVADTGIGVPRERQSAIFEKYVQGGSSISRTHGGTGLGLAICQHIVELMGGRIWVESDAGRGSTFHFTASLPADAAPTAAPQSQGNGASAASEETAARTLGARILLAEDSASSIALIKAYLAAAGCELEVCTDGVSALERLQQGSYNLALLDVRMPGLDGYEVTRRFREWERAQRRPRTPIVAVTAHAFQEDVEQAIKAGADAHLTKPFRREELLDAIELYQRPDGAADLRVLVPEFVKELAPEFLRRQRHALSAATSALRSGEFDPVQSFAHNIKGCGKSFGFPRLTDLGREIERAAKDRNWPALRAQFDELREYLTAVDIEP